MAVLVQRPVKNTLFGMAVPMLAGTFAMNAYNLTDAWFVAQLGTTPLAAMSFTFPVVMMLSCLFRGIGNGMTAIMSHAVGRHDHHEAATITTHGHIFGFLASMVLAVVGYFTIEPLFSLLGASENTMPLLKGYMGIWYAGIVFMSLPMLGNGLLIALGDSRNAAYLMMLGTLLNLVLDPLMIFGGFGVPAMGIRGAALATVIGQSVSTIWLIYLLRKKHKLLIFEKMPFANYIKSLVSILKLGIPNILSMMLMPISAGVITMILARYGEAAVAASGAAGRLEGFFFVIPMSLGMSLMPFTSQNFGAGRMDRVREAIRISAVFAIIYGVVISCVFYAGAPFLASLFSSDEHVKVVLQSYIRIICFGYGMMEVNRYSGIILNGLHKPTQSAMLNGVRVIFLLIPLSLLGSHLHGVNGVFWGRLTTDILAGCIGLFWVSKTCAAVAAKHEAENSVVVQPAAG